MNKLKAWVQDKKNQPIIIAVSAVVLIGVVVLYLKMFGIIGGKASAPPATPPQTASVPGQPPATPPGAPPEPVPGGAPAPSPAPVPGAPPQPTQGAEKGAQPEGQVQPPMLPYRKDPFMAVTKPPTRNQVLMNLVPSVSRIRIAPASVSIRPVKGGEQVAQTEQVLPPQPFRRVAGILWDGGSVKAILETEGQVEIVKPGDVSQYSRVRVESIQPDSVILKTLDTPTPMTVKVNLAGSLAAQEGTSEMAPAPTPARTTGEGPPPGAMWEGPPPGF